VSDQHTSAGEFDQLAMLHRLPPATVVDRLAFLSRLVAERRVIHVGFADAGCTEMQQGAGTWLHARLARTAASLTGLDVDKAGVEAARAAGYEAYAVDCRDAEAVAALGLVPADVVVAGEVIEHLDAPGPFLDALAGLVEPGGLVALTTPNGNGLGNALLAIVGVEVTHPDHVVSFTWRNLTTLLGRHGWSVVEVHTSIAKVKSAGTSGPLTRLGGALLLALTRVLARLGAPFVADTLVVVARHERD
jgi:2-polyprenyl-3-methyl-5-hydroxy-6-metoxy-1,4-benzoquinol methylase